MKGWKKWLLLGGAGVAVVGGVALALGGVNRDGAKSSEYSITVSVGGPGSVGGDYPARSEKYVFDAPTTITIGPAVPNGDAIFNGWRNEMGDVEGTDATLSVVVDGNLYRFANFTPFQGITPTRLNFTKAAVSQYKIQVWKTGYKTYPGNPLAVDTFHIGWRYDREAAAFFDDYVEFTLTDDVGNPVGAGFPIELSTDRNDGLNPECVFALKRMVTDPFFGDWAFGTPVVYYTDSEGKVQVRVRVFWYPISPKTEYGYIAGGGLVGATPQVSVCAVLCWGQKPIKDNLQEMYPEAFSAFEYIGKTVGTYALAYQNLNVHNVNAKWVDLPSVSAIGVISAEIMMPPQQILEVYNGDYDPSW